MRRLVAEGEKPDIVIIHDGAKVIPIGIETLSLARRLLSPDLFLAFRDRFEDQFSNGLLCAEEITAERAPNVYVELLPRDAWENLLVALRTGDLGAVARWIHGGSFQG